jgi:integrase
MSVFKQKHRKAWTYEFQYKGKAYKGTTGQLTREDAQAFELLEQQRVRRREAGIADLRDAPHFAEWAGVYYQEKAEGKRRVKRPDQIDVLVRVALRFWGRRPKDPSKVVAGEPYRDLTLADPITRPELLDEFEDWMEGHSFSGSHRNHLRTQISGMYKAAMLPKYRKRTGIAANPMEGVPRDRRKVRDVALSVEQLQAWLSHASYHVRLAMSIAALAPKLRLANVLALDWREHIDRAFTRITIYEHKTDASGKPIVQEISAQLAEILKDAKLRNPRRWVVAYRGARVHSIRDGVRAAAERANIPYGRGRADGATFHTIRHAVATWFAEMAELTEPQRASLLAHANITTTQGYTHLRPVKDRPSLERLSAQTPLHAIVTQPWKRWSKNRKPIVPRMPEGEKREDSDRSPRKAHRKTRHR